VEEDDNDGQPNKILFVQNLPEDAPPAAITAALKQVLARIFRVSSCLQGAFTRAFTFLTLHFPSFLDGSAACRTCGCHLGGRGSHLLSIKRKSCQQQRKVR
jgi:hypothetical protein